MTDHITPFVAPIGTEKHTDLLARRFGFRIEPTTNKIIDPRVAILDDCLKQYSLQTLETPALVANIRHPDRKLASHEPITLPFEPSDTERETFWRDIATISNNGKMADLIFLNPGHLLRLDEHANHIVREAGLVKDGERPTYNLNIATSKLGIHCTQNTLLADARYSHISESELMDATLDHCNFEHAKLMGLYANKTNFNGCNFDSVWLNQATIEHSTFDNCNFAPDPDKEANHKSTADYCNFENCTFKDCDLREMRFNGCTFDNCTFINTRVDNAHFMHGTKFIGAKSDLSGLVEARSAHWGDVHVDDDIKGHNAILIRSEAAFAHRTTYDGKTGIKEPHRDQSDSTPATPQLAIADQRTQPAGLITDRHHEGHETLSPEAAQAVFNAKRPRHAPDNPTGAHAEALIAQAEKAGVVTRFPGGGKK